MATDTAEARSACLDGIDFGRNIHRIDMAVLDETAGPQDRRPVLHLQPVAPEVSSAPHNAGESHGESHGRVLETRLLRGARFRNLHPMLGKRNDLWRLSEFDIERLVSIEDVYLFRGVAHDNPARRATVRPRRGPRPRPWCGSTRVEVTALPDLERMLMESLCAPSDITSRTARPGPTPVLEPGDPARAARPWTVPAATGAGSPVDWHLPPSGLGLEKIVLRMRRPTRRETSTDDGPGDDRARLGRTHDRSRADPRTEPIAPLTPYRQRVVKTQRRGAVYPYELIRMLTPSTDRIDVPAG